jgi:lysophospholipase L1-like esterase
MTAMRICFLGDSYVSGAYDAECLGWAGRICAAARTRGHDVSIYNLGIRGETSVQLAARWRSEASIRQSPLQEGRLVFEFGMNDVREVNGRVQVSEQDTLAAARRIVSEASQWKPTLMIGPPPVNDNPRKMRVSTASERLAALCSELKVPYFDSNRLLLQNEVWLQDITQVDGTHPAARGYAEWARLIDAWHAWREWLP